MSHMVTWFIRHSTYSSLRGGGGGGGGHRVGGVGGGGALRWEDMTEVPKRHSTYNRKLF